MSNRKQRRQRTPSNSPASPARAAAVQPGRMWREGLRVVPRLFAWILTRAIDRLATRLIRSAAVWSILVLGLVGVFLWQRHYPMAGLWIATSDLVVGGESNMDTTRMTFVWQLLMTHACLFGLLPIWLGRTGRRVSAGDLETANDSGVRLFAAGCAGIWTGYCLVVASWFLPIGSRLAGWIVALPLIRIGLSWPMTPDAHAVWLGGVCVTLAAYELAVAGLLLRCQHVTQREPKARSRMWARPRARTILIIVGAVIPVVMAALLYSITSHWFLAITPGVAT